MHHPWGPSHNPYNVPLPFWAPRDPKPPQAPPVTLHPGRYISKHMPYIHTYIYIYIYTHNRHSLD